MVNHCACWCRVVGRDPPRGVVKSKFLPTVLWSIAKAGDVEPDRLRAWFTSVIIVGAITGTIRDRKPLPARERLFGSDAIALRVLLLIAISSASRASYLSLMSLMMR
jgi:hypothetical protein